MRRTRHSKQQAKPQQHENSSADFQSPTCESTEPTDQEVAQSFAKYDAQGVGYISTTSIEGMDSSQECTAAEIQASTHKNLLQSCHFYKKGISRINFVMQKELMRTKEKTFQPECVHMICRVAARSWNPSEATAAEDCHLSTRHERCWSSLLW